MISISYQIASAKGLASEDRKLVQRLVSAWDKHVGNNQKCHRYYTMHNRLVDLGISVPPELKNLSAACGWGKKCVDVMVEHSKFDGFTSADSATQALLDVIYRRNKLRVLYRKATTSALEQCFNLYFVTKDEAGHSRVTAYPARVSGVTWDDANNCLEAAMFVVSTRKKTLSDSQEPNWVNVITAENVISIKSDGGSVWKAEYTEHGLGHLPVFLAAHEATLERPFGTSRITREVMGYIDSAVRANVNEEIASAFAASSQKYLLGTDGDPFTDKTRWDAFIGSIFNIDMTNEGTVPQFGQLPQPSMQPMSDHWRLLCGRMSAATGIHVSQFGMVHDQPASSDAIYAENEPLILKVKDWNEDVSDTLTDVAIACLATEEGATFDEIEERGISIEARFRNPAMPTLAQQTDSSVKIASVVDGFANTETFWEMNGFGKEERDRIMRELRRERARDAILSFASSEQSDVANSPNDEGQDEGEDIPNQNIRTEE